MDSINSLGNQLGWCITSRDYLHNLQNEVKYVGKQYYDAIDVLAHDQYLIELHKRIKVLMLEFVATADHLIRHIEDEHLLYINNQAQSLAAILADIENKMKDK